MRQVSYVVVTVLVVVGLIVFVGEYYGTPPTTQFSESDRGTSRITPPIREVVPVRDDHESVENLLLEREQLNQTVWAQEVAAQKHEQTIVKYWDQMLRPEDDKFAILSQIPFDTITLDTLGDTTTLDWDIKKTVSGGEGRTLDQKGWRDLLHEMKERGYIIEGIEFHQSSYEEPTGKSPVSIFDTLLNVENKIASSRLTISTKLRVEWTDRQDEEGLFIPGKLTLSDTTILERVGAPPFHQRILKTKLNEWSFPLVYDLNNDGFSDILLPGNNIAMWNKGNGEFDEQPLFKTPGVLPPYRSRTPISAVISDFNNDGIPDILIAGKYKPTPQTDPAPRALGLYLFHGDTQGEFTTPGQLATLAPLDLRSPMSMTVGDIDHDGDLDVWLAQYKNPYDQGQMPTPFYDANDGYPSYLLINTGNGMFEDATVEAGLAAKRNRRTFAASFVDLDDDLDLDLLVSSDFAGTDVYLNDGSGSFIDQTNTLLDETSNFGMGHTFADYNQDGALDFFVIGMASTTMRRLNQMGLIREDRPEYLEMRTRMGYGNRMYLSKAAARFEQPAFNDSIARSGWSWGSTSFDFDSDGDQDIYVANGHKSGKTTKDYCTQFWCHDIYTGDSSPSKSVLDLFRNTVNMSLGKEHYSWDGFQKNHLFMNQSHQDFINVGYLTNTAIVDDCRNVVSDDFNNDGKPDLLVISRDSAMKSGYASDTMHLLTNQWPIQNNWIGVRLQESTGGPSSVGAVIRVSSDQGEQLAHIVTGDSFRTQHAQMKHFGLGKQTSIESIEVRWPDGKTQKLVNPDINSYHTIRSIDAK